MKNTKKSILTSAIILCLCFSMLIGTTYAWFTDSASSGSNIIQSGNLDVKMHWSEDLEDWNEVDGSAIFTYDNWEPGYTEVKYIKVENAGSLAFKWQLNIEAEGEVGKLAEAIDVYYISSVTDKITSLSGRFSIGKLNEVIENKIGLGGNLLPSDAVVDSNTPADYVIGETVLAIAFHMDEEAGNKYQNESIGDGFDISLVATQLGFESDSFGNNYDDAAEWPTNVIVKKTTITKAVDKTSDNKVANDVSMPLTNGASAEIPAGVKLEAGVDKLTLAITPMDKSNANVVLDENEAMLNMDVHIEGVAADNEVVMAIKQEKLLPVGLNMGNYRFYHVENGETVTMTLREDGATPVHNNFDYDTATGDVVLYLKSFSEVAMIAGPSAWEGGIANEFAGGDGTKESPYLIANADQFAYFSKIVSIDNEHYGDKHYKLIIDLDLNGAVVQREDYSDGVFYPVGYWKPADGGYFTYGGAFRGVFDGNGNTIANIYQNTWLMKGDYEGTYWNDAMGLFGYVYDGTVKNLTVKEFESDGEFTPTGVIAAYAAGNSTFENISIVDCNPRVYNTGNGGIIGVAGDTSTENKPDNKITLKNITVDQTNKISALWGSWDVACGGLVGMFRGYSKLDMDNCHVAAQIDVNNDVCANYQYYWYRYSGMFIGSVRRNTKDANGYTVAYTDNISAKDCTYTYGAWNEYWYCELVANSLASYTHDHQFSRLTKIKNESEIKDKDGNWNKQGNFVIPNADNTAAECFHIFKDSNGNLYQHFHDKGDETNGYEPYETVDVNGDGIKEEVLKEDRQCYYMPFAQLMTGDGWGVKAFYNASEFGRGDVQLTLVDDGTVKSETKFAAQSSLPKYTLGESIEIGKLFKSIVDDTKLSKTTVFVTASPANPALEGSFIDATYSIDPSDWTKSTLKFAENCKGMAKIVITDYFYCTETVIYLEVDSGEFIPDIDDSEDTDLYN